MDLTNEIGFLGDQEGAMELLKAMQAGSITGRDTADQSLTYEPLKAESLEATIKILEARTKDIVLYNTMPKLTAYNTVEEFLQLESYGSETGGFYNEGELSDVEDSKYVRRAEHIKYLQVTGEVTMQAQMVRSYVDAMKKEVENKAMWIMKRANAAMTKGDASIVPQEWNGLFKQHASIGTATGFLYPTLEDYYTSEVVIDLRGASLKQTDVEEAAVRVDANYGNVSHLFAPTSVISALSRDYFNNQRIMLNANAESGYVGTIGTVAKSIATTIGDVALMPDKFMKHDFNNGRKTTDPATSSKAPAAPVADPTTPTALVTDSLSKYQTSEQGTVYYAVSAVNRYGESQIVPLGNAAVNIAASNSVDLKFTAGSGTYSATGFVIYRSEITSASSPANVVFYPIFKVSVAEHSNGYDGGVAGIVRDRGRFLPNTEQAFLTEIAEEVLSFKQLAPISKLDLAIIAMSRRFITFLFATPQLYAPKKMVRFINCAKKLV